MSKSKKKMNDKSLNKISGGVGVTPVSMNDLPGIPGKNTKPTTAPTPSQPTGSQVPRPPRPTRGGSRP